MCWENNAPSTRVVKVKAPWYGLTETVKSAGDLFAAALVKVGRVENPWFPKVFSNWFGEDFACCATHIDIVEKVGRHFQAQSESRTNSIFGLTARLGQRSNF